MSTNSTLIVIASLLTMLVVRFVVVRSLPEKDKEAVSITSTLAWAFLLVVWVTSSGCLELPDGYGPDAAGEVDAGYHHDAFTRADAAGDADEGAQYGFIEVEISVGWNGPPLAMGGHPYAVLEAEVRCPAGAVEGTYNGMLQLSGYDLRQFQWSCPGGVALLETWDEVVQLDKVYGQLATIDPSTFSMVVVTTDSAVIPVGP